MVDRLVSNDQSTININGSRILESIRSWDTSEVNFTDSELNGGIRAEQQSTININSGLFGNTLSNGPTYTTLSHESTVNIRGGDLDTSIFANHSTKLNMTGGKVYRSIKVSEYSSFDLKGGEILGDVIAEENASFRFFAQNFGEFNDKAGQILHFEDFDFSKTSTFDLT